MEFTYLPFFHRSADFFDETDLLELELSLLLNPMAGPLVPGGRGLRKLRRPIRGRGKRGGARVIYYYIDSAQHIYFVFAYAKNRQSDLTPKEVRQFGELVQCHLP